jgi:hypothetical protein
MILRMHVMETENDLLIDPFVDNEVKEAIMIYKAPWSI